MYQGKKFSREQLVIIVNSIFIATMEQRKSKFSKPIVAQSLALVFLQRHLPIFYKQVTGFDLEPYFSQLEIFENLRVDEELETLPLAESFVNQYFDSYLNTETEIDPYLNIDFTPQFEQQPNAFLEQLYPVG